MAYGFRTLCLFSPSSGAFTAYRKHKLRASLSDFPFAVRMPVLRTYILCQLSVRAADLDSTFTWPTPGLFQFWSIMIPKLSCKNSLGAPIFRRRIILAGEERRLLAAEAAESCLEKKAARSASFAEKARQIAPKSPRTM